MTDVGWAWYPSLEMCDTSHLSLEFLTKKPDGTLLYNGPMTPPESEETLITDFISLELEAGNPRLLIDFGSGTLELKIKPPRRLDDGDWHRLDIFWDTENVRMVLDVCRFAPIHEPEDGSAALFNTTLCEAKGQVPPFNEYLDVNAPLQIGGVSHAALDPTHFRWNHVPHGKGFSGCIRNFIHNSKVLSDSMAFVPCQIDGQLHPSFRFFNWLDSEFADLRSGGTGDVASKSTRMRSAR